MQESGIELTRRKILSGLSAVGVAGVGAGLGTQALLSDEEEFEGTKLTAGSIDLAVTAKIVAANDHYEGAEEGPLGDARTANGDPVVGIQAGDVKPGDWAIVCFDLAVTQNPGCVTVFTENATNAENGQTGPESEVDPTGGDSGDGNGELQEAMLATVWDAYDGPTDGSEGGTRSDLSGLDPTTNTAGTNVVDESWQEPALDGRVDDGIDYTSVEEVHTTYGSEDGVTLGAPPGAGGPGTAFNTRRFYLLLEVPAAAGNEIQSDSLSFDLRFSAVQARNNDDCALPSETPEPPTGECPPCSVDTSATGGAESNLLSAGPDPTAGFPAVDLRVRVDTATGNAGDLTASEFAVCENGCGQTLESVDFEAGGAVDIVVVFDDTGSLGGEINALQSDVTSLTDDIENAGIDARYALVSFKDEAELDQDFTDASTFQTAVNSLEANGGNSIPEDNLDALAVGTGNAAGQDGSGAELSAFRSGAQRVVIDITDVGAHDEGDHGPDIGTTRFSQAEVESFLDDGNFTFYAVAPSEVTGELISKRDIAENVDDGTWEDINDANFSEILTDITGSLTEPAYVLSYTTTNPAADGSNRTVDLQIDDPDAGSLYEDGAYTAPNT